MWLIIDKFVKNPLKRNILCDAIGDRMSLIHEYARNKENRIIKKIVEQGAIILENVKIVF